MSGIQAKTVVKYAILPGVIPRLKTLFASGFGYIAFLMAQIYSTVRLLPAGHPYLNPENIGKFGIRHVIAECANALVISKNNIDQITVFILMLTGTVLLGVQLIALLLSLLFGSAIAASIFITPNPDLDIAYMLLDQVFGVGDGTVAGNFFNSCVSAPTVCPGETTNPTYPWPFHRALQNMFEFYSIGILLIGTIIFLYFMLVVVVETATTGTPFGQRFKNLWVPVRLVIAVGLLIPMGQGYNSGQYLTFASAKFGSSLATNAWISFNTTLAANMGGVGNVVGEKGNLIAMPKPPDAATIVEAISIAHSCAFAHYLHHEDIIKGMPLPSASPPAPPAPPQIKVLYPEYPPHIKNYLGIKGPSGNNPNRYAIKPYFVKTPTASQAALDNRKVLLVEPDTKYEEAIEFFTSGDIFFRFGLLGGVDVDGDGDKSNEEKELYKSHQGQVEPTCGEIRIPIIDRRPTNTGTNIHAKDGYLGSIAMQRMYFELIRNHWYDTAQNENYIDFAGRMALLHQPPSNDKTSDTPCNMGCKGGAGPNPNLPNSDCSAAVPTGAETRDCAMEDIAAKWKQNAINEMQVTINTRATTIWNDYNLGTNEFDVDSTLLERGWGGAGIWFNKIAQVNGAFISTFFNPPEMNIYPKLMEDVRKAKKKMDSKISGVAQFNPNAAEGSGAVDLNEYGSGAKPKAMILYRVFEYWNADNKNQGNVEVTVTAGALEAGMNLVFGTHGLFAMTDENANIHPLSQLVALGKGLVESAIRNIAGSSMGAALGGFAKAIDKSSGAFVEAASGFLLSTAFVGLTAGFVLYYVLPFLPFVYFYFAVASWVKTIFEAMVGVPLWALAHLRIDGDGLPGESAANGYFLIFEIFLRPVLTVAGLLAAMLIFTAQVRVLNFIWLLVTDNVGGHNSDPTIGVLIPPNAAANNTGFNKSIDISFKRSIVDEFFYTVLYAIIVYMLATASFKLIDKIPDNILRWMGQGVSSFGDINQDPAEGLTRYAALGGMTAGREISEGVQSLSGGLGNAVGRGVSGPLRH